MVKVACISPGVCFLSDLSRSLTGGGAAGVDDSIFSLSQRSRLGGLKEVETESFSWFRFDILILGFLTLAWTANGGLLANVP